MPFPPDTYIIGAQKSGTTTLAQLLASHPDITISSPKEPRYYTKNFSKGLGWYRSCFPGDDNTILIDASPDVSGAPTDLFPSKQPPGSDPWDGAAGRIYSLAPNARFIYLLREPASRTYSAYWHAVRAGYEKRPFRQAILKYDRYLRTSDYYGQILNYLQYFELKSFCFLLFEEFSEDPENTVAKCLDFLNLRPMTIEKSQVSKKNPSYQYNNLGNVLRGVAGSKSRMMKITKVLKTITPQRFHEPMRRLFSNPIPPMSKDDRDYVNGIFKDRNQSLAEVTGLDLQVWK